ncbi:Imm26 family immunity protein [Brachyspira intermedia]|uniref:Imm26 family immunity protein n=1 Tax=Brachyspira intermedia TaxID=84377 RepID=UPI003003B00F
MKYCEKKEGSIFFIPLFLPNDIKDNIKSYSKTNFTSEGNYAFGRLIEIYKSGGDLIEIFNYTGNIPNDKYDIIKSGLMFEPMHISMAFTKKRWRFIFEELNYDRERDSNYSKIIFLLGDEYDPKLCIGGKIKTIKKYDTNKYNEWIVYTPTEIETMIKKYIISNK